MLGRETREPKELRVPISRDRGSCGPPLGQSYRVPDRGPVRHKVRLQAEDSEAATLHWRIDRPHRRRHRPPRWRCQGLTSAYAYQNYNAPWGDPQGLVDLVIVTSDF